MMTPSVMTVPDDTTTEKVREGKQSLRDQSSSMINPSDQSPCDQTFGECLF